MDHNEQRDYAEEAYNRAEMEREGREEYCTCAAPSWVSGMMVVSEWDAEGVYRDLKARGREGQLIDNMCERPYHPDFSFDPYA